MSPSPPALLSPRALLSRTSAHGLFGLLAGIALFLLTALDSLLVLRVSQDGVAHALRFLALLALTIPGTAVVGLLLGVLASLLEQLRLFATALIHQLPLPFSPRAKDGAGLLFAALLLALPLDFLSGLSPRGPKALLRAAVTGYHLYVSPIPTLVAGFRPLFALALALLVLLLMSAGAWIFLPRGPRTRPLSLAATGVVLALVLYAYHYDSRPSYGHSENTLHYPLVFTYSTLTVFGAGFAARAFGAMEWASASPRALRTIALAALALSLGVVANAHWGMDASPSVKAAFWNRSVIARRYAEIGRWLVDRDHDGSSPLFGGGDPDDHDPQRGPNAREIPGNGVDDNGIGGDLDRALLATAPRAPAPGELVPPAVEAPFRPKEAPPGAVDLASPEAASPALPGGDSARPPIVVISVDALRADRLSLYGNPRPTSPKLARWAERGLVFTRAISQATNTGHSFCSLLRSSYGDAVVDPNVPTLTQLLEKAGYHTAFLNSRRLDDWLLQKRWQPYRTTMIQDFDVLHLGGAAWWTAEELTTQAMAYVDRLRPGSPEFLWIHYNDTHQPRVPRPSYGYGSSELDVYDAAVSYTDAQVGRLLDHLEARGFLERALVFFTADHGESFFEHGTFDHSNKPYMDNDHVPLVVLAPGLAPRRIGAAVGLVDIAPTALAHAGLPVPYVHRGIDLLAAARLPTFPERGIITEPPRNDPEAAFFAWALVEGHHKYLFDRKGVSEELYDLDQDPGEQRNLIERAPEQAAKMRAALGRFLDLEGNRRGSAVPGTGAP
jgi:arylsulfatase A-like enzyme